jgi:glycosyltransferase involved in cell wall biosynthesis
MQMKPDLPLISVLIPCFNAERWIAAAIQSALEQTWQHKEVVVVDDGSTDGSLEVIRSFGDAVRFETGPNRGGNAARNRLLELSAGEWVQYLDADDYLTPEKLELQYCALSDPDGTDAAYSPVYLELWAGEHVLGRELLPIPEPRDPWILLARWELPQTGGVLWRRQALVDLGGWNAEMPCCQEHELYLRALIAGKRFVYCSAAGAVYRQWSEETVCKKNKPRVHQWRLEIERRAEEWLRQSGELDADRLSAINQARFETARSMWQYDARRAADVMRIVTATQPQFIPTGAAAPRRYRRAYRWFGFRGAERIADWARHSRAFSIKSQTVNS